MQDALHSSTGPKRDPTNIALLTIAGFAAIGLALCGPIPQNPAYHQFVDNRTIWGIPYFGDVVTNAGFVLVGAWALAYMIKSANPPVVQQPSDRLPYWYFFAGLLLTGIGSAYYHWHPTNQRLLWDRLPLTIAFMSLFCAASVIYWAWTESWGQGDLRPYAFVQFYPMLAMPIILLRYPSRYSHGHYIWWALAWYAAAKICEHSDRAIYELQDVITGHNVKHILATGAPLMILLMLKRRNPRKPM